jgi:hypothetical protein
VVGILGWFLNHLILLNYMNILDLWWFVSIQSMFPQKRPKNLIEILEKVNQSLAEYPHEKLNRFVNFILNYFFKVSLHLDIILLFFSCTRYTFHGRCILPSVSQSVRTN